MTGASSNSADLLNLAVNELKRLSYDVSDEEFARVVNQLRMTVALGVSNQSDRLEEAARAVRFFVKENNILKIRYKYSESQTLIINTIY